MDEPSAEIGDSAEGRKDGDGSKETQEDDYNSISWHQTKSCYQWIKRKEDLL